jgi:hypothetical protein
MDLNKEKKMNTTKKSVPRAGEQLVADGKGGYLTTEEYRTKNRQKEKFAVMKTKLVTHVAVGPGRGPARPDTKVVMRADTWDLIATLAQKSYLTVEQMGQPSLSVGVGEGAVMVTTLKENEEETKDWSNEDRLAYRQVCKLLFRHDGLLINQEERDE